MLELVTTRTADDVELDGAMYLPDTARDTWRRPILAVHGLTWNFYRGPMRWLPPRFVEHCHPGPSVNNRHQALGQPKDFERAPPDLRAGNDLLANRFGR